MAIMVKMKTCRGVLFYIQKTIKGREKGHYKAAQNVKMFYKNKKAFNYQV